MLGRVKMVGDRKSSVPISVTREGKAVEDNIEGEDPGNEQDDPLFIELDSAHAAARIRIREV